MIRSEDFFQELKAKGCVHQRITGSHHIFRIMKNPPRVFPVSVHDHKVREDVRRDVFKVIGMPDEEYIARRSAMPSPKKMNTENSGESATPGSGGNDSSSSTITDAKSNSKCNDTDSASTANAKSKRTRNRNALRDRVLAAQAAKRDAEEKAAHATMRKEQEDASQRKLEQFTGKAERLLAGAPGRIGAGEYAVVAGEIAMFLRESEAIYLSESLEKLVLDLSFMGVTAWIEEARAVLREMKVEKIKNSHNLGQNALHCWASLPFDCRQFGDVLQVLTKLKGKHWRYADSVKEMKMSAVREMGEITRQGQGVIWGTLALAREGLPAGSLTRDAVDELASGLVRQVSALDSFIKSLLGESQVFDKITKESLGSELELRHMMRGVLFGEILYSLNLRVIRTPMFNKRIQAARILVQLVEEEWFASADDYSSWRDVVLRYAKVKDSLTESVMEFEETSKHVASPPAKETVKNLRLPTWHVGLGGLVNADAPGVVLMCRELTESLCNMVVVGEWDPEAESSRCFSELLLHLVQATAELAPFVRNIVSHVQISPDIRLAADTTAFFAVLTDLVDFLLESSEKFSARSEEGMVLADLQKDLKCGTMRVWWRCWRGSGDDGDILKMVLDAARKQGCDVPCGDVNPLCLERIMIKLDPPGKFLQCRYFPDDQAFADSCQPGRQNHAVQDLLRLGSLHLHRANLPPRWIPLQADVDESLQRVKFYYGFVFGRGIMLREASPMWIERLWEKNVVRNTINLLISKTQPQQSTRLKNLPAHEKRHLDFVFGKLENTRAPERIKEAQMLLWEDVMKPHFFPTKYPQPRMIDLVVTFHKLAVLEEEVTESITKVIKSHSGSKDFKTVFEGKGGVARFYRDEEEEVASFAEAAAGSGSGEK